ncbi:MAG: TetR/AcrR family transcriptional regulator C-terminal domain-containing protein [Acidimicrobiales bacterium]
MRSLGTALGVEAMSLYEYVASKDEILVDILDLLFTEVELPGEDARPWEDLACDLFCAFRRVLLAHPHTVTLVASRSVRSVEALAPIEESLGIFRRAGFDPQGAVDAHRVLQSFTIGYLLAEASVLNDPLAVPNSWGTAAYALRELPTDRLPNLSELAGVAIDRVADEQFPVLLRVIVSGLDTRLRRPK